MLEWLTVAALALGGISLLYYVGPDADQDWVWLTPGAAAATTLWLPFSMLGVAGLARLIDRDILEGLVSALALAVAWLYVSAILIVWGAELNAEIDRASPHWDLPAPRSVDGRVMIGARAIRALRRRRWCGESHPGPLGREEPALSREAGSFVAEIDPGTLPGTPALLGRTRRRRGPT
jgi:membrane protein